MSVTAAHIVVAGKVSDKSYQAARLIAEGIAKENSNVTIETLSLFETEWEDFIKNKSNELNVGHRISPIVFYNEKYIVGGLEEFENWAYKVYQYEYAPNSMYCNSLARKMLHQKMLDTGHAFCYMDVRVGKEEPNKVVFELYDDVCPLACENFKKLCCSKDSESYINTPFHRVVPSGWVQGGDIESGRGDGGRCVINDNENEQNQEEKNQEEKGSENSEEVGELEKEVFRDECFAIKHDTAGVLSMANKDSAHTNGSQFFVTLSALPWLDCKRVAFGRVVSGMRVFRSIEKVPLKNERPTEDCVVVDCGLVEIGSKIESASMQDPITDEEKVSSESKSQPQQDV